MQSGDAKLSRQHVRATKIVVSGIAAHAVVLVQVVVLIGARAVLPACVLLLVSSPELSEARVLGSDLRVRVSGGVM